MGILRSISNVCSRRDEVLLLSALKTRTRVECPYCGSEVSVHKYAGEVTVYCRQCPYSAETFNYHRNSYPGSMVRQ